MRAHAPDPADERGDTLLELLIAIAIAGLVVATIIGSLVVGITVSDVEHKQATASAYLRDYAEAIDNAVAGNGSTPNGGYVACATTATSAYASPPGLAALPSGYQQSLVAVAYWTGSGWSSACPSPDTGVQLLTIAVASTDQRVTEQLDIVVRRPCGTGVSPCT
jgi:type II secretory pathway pseudopilin PulG